MTDVLTRFTEAADVSLWNGLPPHAETLLGVDPSRPSTLSGEIGEPPAEAQWVPLASGPFTDGLRAWLQGSQVVLLEGRMPRHDDGELFGIPDLGEPDDALDYAFGPLTIVDGERIYASRGLAVCVNPRSGVLLALRGFAPTTPADYRARLRNVAEPVLRPGGRRTR